MPRPALPKPGFSLLRLHNSQRPHHIATLSSAAKTDLVDSVAQDIEGCIYAIGYYVESGVLNSDNTVQFDQVIQKIKYEEKRALRTMFRKMKIYKKAASEARRTLKHMKRLIRQKKREREQQNRQSQQQNHALEAGFRPDADVVVAPEQALPCGNVEGVLVSKATTTRNSSADRLVENEEDEHSICTPKHESDVC